VLLAEQAVTEIEPFSRADCWDGVSWCKFDYNRQLELARQTRDPLVAVQAELFRLWFRLSQTDKSRSIELGNEVFAKLGFDRRQKCAALERLEKAGFVKVNWRKTTAILAQKRPI